MDLARTEVFGAIQGNQQGARQRAEALQLPLLLQHKQDFLEEGKNLLRFHRVEQIPNVVVARYLMDIKQALGIAMTFAALHHALVCQKDGVWVKNTRSGA